MNQIDRDPSPFPFGDLRAKATRFIDRLLPRGESPQGRASEAGPSVTRTDVLETDAAYRVRLKLSGVDPGSVEVDVKARRITIRGAHVERPPEKDGGRWRSRRSGRRFSRSIALPERVMSGRAEAELQNGILIIDVPKEGRGEGG